jgi:hypothetical protein
MVRLCLKTVLFCQLGPQRYQQVIGKLLDGSTLLANQVVVGTVDFFAKNISGIAQNHPKISFPFSLNQYFRRF